MSIADLIPPLGPDDVYFYAHANGAISLLRADAKTGLVPLDEAARIAVAHRDAGGLVHLDHEEGPLAAQVVERLRTLDIPVVAFASPRPPDTWPRGTDALMEAASVGADRILDDLLARGADPGRVDDSGSTALHHAAIGDNAHAVASLVAAGAPVDRPNAAGMTPRMLAVEGGHAHALAQLDAVGAASGMPADTVEFKRSLLTSAQAYTLLIVVNVGIALVVLWPPSPWDPVALAAVVGGLWLLTPTFAYWRGGQPVRLEGSMLHFRPAFGGTRTVDLAGVSVATTGGSTRPEPHLGARHFVLGHPQGHPMDRRALRGLVTDHEDVDTLLDHADRFTVVTLHGGQPATVIPPVAAVLASAGTLVLPAAQRQIADARRAGWSG